jgi:hypothetical protein
MELGPCCSWPAVPAPQVGLLREKAWLETDRAWHGYSFCAACGHYHFTTQTQWALRVSWPLWGMGRDCLSITTQALVGGNTWTEHSDS